MSGGSKKAIEKTIPTKNRQLPRPFTLLEVMLAVAIAALAAGAIFWRIGAFIAHQRFESDGARMRNILSSSHLLAMNTQSDWRLEMGETKSGWTLRLTCLQDPEKNFSCGKLAPLKILLNEEPVDWIDFYATGQTFPKGHFQLQKDTLKLDWNIPDIFHQREGGFLGPFHPDELEEE